VKTMTSGLTHNEGNNMQKWVSVSAFEELLGVIAALLLWV
jgi:hypothetical protein